MIWCALASRGGYDARRLEAEGSEGMSDQGAITATDTESRGGRCDYCGSLDHHPLFDGFFPDIVECASCGLIFNAVMPSEEELASIYTEEYYQSKDSLKYGYTDYRADRSNIVKTSRKRLREIEKLKTGGTLLDVGCAFGFFLEVARERGWSVSGVEISQYAAHHAATELQLDVVHDDAETWTYPERSYDVITMWDLIEHLRDPAGTLRKLSRALKEDGILVLSTPDVESLPARLMKERWLGWQLRNEHLHYFSPATLERMLNAAGLEVVRRTRVGKHVKFDLFVDRLALYGRLAAAVLRRMKRVLPASLSFYVNPLDIICVYARVRTEEDVS
jgi:2-polyprenyl-3-methyl-5-hydroxy-6-metoxy-1,4-benzoquinol methylase